MIALNGSKNIRKFSEKLEDELTSAPVMAHFNTKKETTLKVGASPVGISVILSQKVKGQKDPQVVAYAGRPLTAVEKRYSWDSDIVAPFRKVKDELRVTSENIVLRGTRIVPPEALQQRASNIAHESHQGLSKIKALLRTDPRH